MKNRYITMLLCVLFTPATRADDCATLNAVEWLAGQWISVSEQTVTSENWQPVSESSWEGRGETRDKSTGELRESESLRLLSMNGEVFYLAKVAHNNYPVAFTMTECSGTRAVFENPEHDFPKKIEYLLQPAGDLHVQVSDGSERGFEIRFQKTK